MLVIPVVVGVLGCVTKDLGKWIDRLGITVSTAFLQKTLDTDESVRHDNIGGEPRVPALVIFYDPLLWRK